MTTAVAVERREWQEWAEQELGGAELGDARLDSRLVEIAGSFLGAPEGSIPRSTGGWASAKATYRFFSNHKVDPQTIYDRHRKSTLERCSEESVLLAISDTTYLDYTGHLHADDLGPLADLSHCGLVLQSTMVVTPARLPLGLIEQNVWARDRDEFAKYNQKAGQSKKKARNNKKKRCRKRNIEQKESVKWIKSLEVTRRFANDLGREDAKVISVFDREGDVFEVLSTAAKPDGGVGLLVRASRNRCVDHPQKRLWESMEKEAVAGTLQITVPRRPGEKERTTTLTIRHAEVTIRPPRDRKLEVRAPVKVFCVYAVEEAPPEHAEPISWMLLTTEGVFSFDDACTILRWYTCRWIIEVFFKVLKSGCKAEERQLETKDRLIRCLTLDTIVAWRILHLTVLGREVPHLPCTVVFQEHEWKALWVFVNRTPNVPETVPCLRDAIRLVGRLGGHLGRTRDGEPGPMTLWRGLQRLPDIAGMWVVCRGDPGQRGGGP